jgi:hypothetical protein
MRVLYLIESRPSFRLVDIKTHPDESYLCLAFAEHAIKTHGAIPFYLRGHYTAVTALSYSA